MLLDQHQEPRVTRCTGQSINNRVMYNAHTRHIILYAPDACQDVLLSINQMSNWQSNQVTLIVTKYPIFQFNIKIK